MKIQDFDKKIQATINFYREELKGLRTGVANASMVDNVKVTPYENSAPLTIKELATISTPSPNLIVITPWDKSVVEHIVSALRSLEAGFNPSVDGTIIRITIPDLTQEQRENYVKIAKKKLEEAKIAIRNIRQDMIKSLGEQEKNDVISEDEMNNLKKQVEEKVKKANEELQQIFSAKEKELLTA